MNKKAVNTVEKPKRLTGLNIRALEQKIDDYFNTVTYGQLLADLREVGFEIPIEMRSNQRYGKFYPKQS